MLSAEQQAALVQLDVPQWHLRDTENQEVVVLSEADFQHCDGRLKALLVSMLFFLGLDLTNCCFLSVGQLPSKQHTIVFDASMLPFSLQDVLATPTLKKGLLQALRGQHV